MFTLRTDGFIVGVGVVRSGRPVRHLFRSAPLGRGRIGSIGVYACVLSDKRAPLSLDQAAAPLEAHHQLGAVQIRDDPPHV